MSKPKRKLHEGPVGRVCSTHQVVKMRTKTGKLVEVRRCKTFKPK